ncbi:unnamed protein product [Schistosoma rodhaini]|nr:unnamed protein product [Schistosoma rodhaini]
MIRLTQKSDPKSPYSSDINNSGLTYTLCSATPVAPDNSGSGLIPHMLLDDSMSNLIESSNLQTDGIDLIKSELATVYKQLSDMRSKMESLAGSLLKHDDLKLELQTLSLLRLLLSKDIVTSELEDRIKVESVIDSIASEVTKRIISRNDVIIYNIPDKVAIKTERNSILKIANL